MNALTTMAAAPTSAGTGELVMSVTVPLATNSWTKRLVEVKGEKKLCDRSAAKPA